MDIITILAGIGLFSICLYITRISKVFVFACGYTLIMIFNWSSKKVMKHPFGAMKHIIIRFVDGIIEYTTCIGEFTSCQYGDWFYYPLFKVVKE